VFDKAKTMMTSDVVALRMSEYDRLLEAQAKTQAAYNIHNAATSLMLILDVFEKNLESLKEGWLSEDGEEPLHKGWAPISSIFGTDIIPTDSAVIINKAVERMISIGDITPKNKWQLLEYLCVEYLAGGGE